MKVHYHIAVRSSLVLLILATGAWAAQNGEIDLQTASPDHGVRVEQSFDGTPDAAGILKQYTLRLPAFEVATYYAAFQRHDPVGGKKTDWVDGTNRIQPLPIHDFRNLKEGGLFLLAKLQGHGYLALLPLTGAGTVAWLAASGADLVVNLGTLGTERVRGDLPVLAWARSDDPYDAARTVWQAALAHPLLAESTRMRSEKRYPDILRNLGWCSWEEYKGSISEKIVLGAIDGIEASKLPIRWVLVDDGHLDDAKRQLVSFDPNSKFPHGWAPILARRRPDGIRWMGVWLNFNGYWNGISAQNKMGALNQDLEAVPGLNLLEPKPGLEHSMAFYDAMIGHAREAGFDFVKVDNQARNLAFYRGTGEPVKSAVANAQALEMASAFHMDALINCMAHGPANIFNTRVSAVTRCSEDYKLGDLPRARRHLHNSYGNMIWLGQTVWGDHDMFHSDDPVAGRMMAVSKAMSGGPVYLSDNPAKFDVDAIRPLSYGSGGLLRPLAPAAPLPESIFVDPFDEAKAFRVVAPLANRSAAVVVYNLTEPEKEVTGYIGPEDYASANGMSQPRDSAWKLPAEGVVLYDWYEKRAMPLESRYSFPMPKFSDRLLLMCPVENGRAVIGRTDKYLSPAAVEVIENTPAGLLLRMKEPGALTIWVRDDRATLRSAQCKLRKPASHLWEADIRAGNQVVEIR